MVSSPERSENRRISAIIPSTSPIVVRVERILSSSALIWPITAARSEVSSRKTSSSEEPSATSSWMGTRAANAMSPTRSLDVPCTSRAWSLLGVVSMPLPPQRFGELRRFRGADADRSADARGQLLERGLDDQLAAVDDQHLIDGLCDLGEHVAGDQHGSLGRLRRRAGSRVASGRLPGRARSPARRGSTARGRRAAPRPAPAADACRASSP